MKVVVDTNVLVSGMLSEHGAPSKVLQMILGGFLRVCFVSEILAEYEAVLKRVEFNFSDALTVRLLAQIVTAGERVFSKPLNFHLPDPSDDVFLEAALVGRVDCLITGNLRHFPASCREGICILPPRKFLEFYAERQSGGTGKIKSPAARYRIHRKPKKKKKSGS